MHCWQKMPKKSIKKHIFLDGKFHLSVGILVVDSVVKMTIKNFTLNKKNLWKKYKPNRPHFLENPLKQVSGVRSCDQDDDFRNISFTHLLVKNSNIDTKKITTTFDLIIIIIMSMSQNSFHNRRC